MVGKIPPKNSNKPKESVESVAAAEYSYLKSKNQELARVLAQTKSDYSQIVAERDQLQRELLTANLQIKKLVNFLSVIEDATKCALGKIVGVSSDITKSLETINFAKKLTQRLDASNTSILQTSLSSNLEQSNSPQQSKTHAVKPMVDGHVILRPTINLRRVNEISREEIERNYTSNARSDEAEEHDANNNAEVEEPRQEPQTNSSFRCRSTSSYGTSAFANGNLMEDDNLLDMENEQDITQNDESENLINRLQTLQEVDEVSEPSSQSETVTSPNSQDLYIGLFTGVQLYTCNASQNIPNFVSNVTRNMSNLSRSPASGASQSLENASQSQENVSNNVERLQMVTTSRGTGERVAAFLQTETPPEVNSFSSSDNTTTLSPSKINKHQDKKSLSAQDTSSSQLSETVDNKNHLSSTNEKGLITSIKKELSHSKFSNSRNSSYMISRNAAIAKFDDTNPLEGPSTLLDNLDSEYEISKIGQMTMLGLEPTHLKNNTSTPCSPVIKLRKRVVVPKLEDTPSRTSDTDILENSNNTVDSTTNGGTPVAKKRSNSKTTKKKKQIVMRNPTVVLRRLSVPKRKSVSPEKRRSVRNSSSKYSSSSSLDDSACSPSTTKERKVSKRSLENTPNEGESKKSKKQKISANERKTKSSPKVSSYSPKKLRKRQIKSLKEISLRKKLRRSK